MPTQVSAGEGVPSVFYRNAIDLNRFSNGIARKIARENIFVIIKASKQLQKIDESKGPSYRAARLRSLIKQTKDSLSKWQQESVDTLIKDLEGVANLQAGFVEGQIKKALPSAMQEKIHDKIGYSVQSVAVSPGFAKAVVTNEPTDISFAAAARSQQRKAGAGVFNLTAKQGAELTLPNGDTVKKAFRGLASQQANRFNQIVRTGLLSGEPTQDIARQLVGTLDFGDKAKTLKQLGQAGGEATKMATHQINTIVRTSVSQVSNAASQNVYKANQEVTEEYRYVSTLDSRTSAVCRNLDGQVFKYNEGPTPPQHFGCRSTTVAVINYKKWGFSPPPAGKRASADGPVPANTTYGKWLYDKRKAGTKFTPGPEQIKVLGTQKAKYFNRLSNKYGPDEAMKKFMREDNSETSLATLQKRYGNPEDIKAKVTKKKASKPKVPKKVQVKPQTKEVQQVPISKLQGIPSAQKLTAIDVEDAFNRMEKMDGEAGLNARKLRQFQERRQTFVSWSNGKETTGFGSSLTSAGKKKLAYLMENPQLKKSLEAGIKREEVMAAKRVGTALEKKAKLGQVYLKQALEEVDEGYNRMAFNEFFTVHKKKEELGGFTLGGANHIVLRRQTYHRSLKKLGKYAPDPLEEIRDAVKRSVTTAAEKRPLPNVDWRLYERTYPKALKGRSRFEGKYSWLTTYVHEMGHQVHYAANTVQGYSSWVPSKYGGSNFFEQFAETFVQYVFDPVGLKKAAPDAYKWVDNAVKVALEAPV
tara:strand:- start:248 stop:2515 length:2268 start_codon:yes stop_codon:yes gene_type:complete